jgi:hypothetical protein
VLCFSCHTAAAPYTAAPSQPFTPPSSAWPCCPADHYENLYAVVAGTKVFTLLPPSDLYRMYLAKYPAARFTPGPDGRLVPVLKQPAEQVMWCPVEPQPEGEGLSCATLRCAGCRTRCCTTNVVLWLWVLCVIFHAQPTPAP